jgi:small subunit ribosomal protein S17
MGRRKTLTGQVVNSKSDKTIMVEVERLQRHPLYGKVIRETTRLMVHDEGNEAQVGDMVRIIEGRPISKRKRWALVEIVPEGR